MIETGNNRRASDMLNSFWARLISVALVLLATVSSVAPAQTNNFATAFLVQPLGARSVGHGEAAVADTMLGTEALWWNPAAMARMRKRELSVHHGQIPLANSDMLSFAYPSKALGTIAASATIVNYGDQQHTDKNGNPSGVLTNRYYVLTVGYATPFGNHFSAGIDVKRIFLRFLCSACIDEDLPNRSSSANALDAGVQFRLPSSIPITLGASVRNIGQALPAKDEAQADPLPRVIQVGIQTKVPLAALAKNQTTLDLRADVLSSPAYIDPSIRVGADLTYKDVFALRGGYKHMGPNDGLEGGLTAGFGLKYNAFQFDIARRFDSSNSLGESGAPTYISLRYVW